MNVAIPPEVSRKLLEFRRRISAERFGIGDWNALGDTVGYADIIAEHPRLFRSLRFDDDDYEAAIYDVFRTMYRRDSQTVELIEHFLNENYPDESTRHASSISTRQKITVTPTVFAMPSDLRIDERLVSVMIPFSSSFRPVYLAIESACESVGMKCKKADDIWETSTFIQDIFNLLFRSRAVVVDFSSKNANVMYETGIAHMLGREVIPITQSYDDVPSDMRHHRVLRYLANSEGLQELSVKLAAKIKTFSPSNSMDRPFDDDLPF